MSATLRRDVSAERQVTLSPTRLVPALYWRPVINTTRRFWGRCFRARRMRGATTVSARGAVAPALERRYAIASPRRADRQIARTIAAHRRRRERLDETTIYLFQRQYTTTENFRYVCLQGDAIITAAIGPTRGDSKWHPLWVLVVGSTRWPLFLALGQLEVLSMSCKIWKYRSKHPFFK